MKRFTLLPTLAALALAAATATAQIPRTISYQGVLATPTGTPVADGNHTLTFRIYESLAAASPLWQEKQSLPVVRGVFNAILGSATAIPSSVGFDRAYFLGVTVDDGSEMTPRTPITSVPYALRAAVADQAASLAPGAGGVVTSINGADGAVTLQGGGAVTVNRSGGTITISAAGGGGGASGIQGIQNSDGSLAIANPNGPVATIAVAAGGIDGSKIAASTINSGHIAAESIHGSNIAPGTITLSHLAPGTVPTSLPPSGSAGGELTGSYPNPAIANGAVNPAKISPAGAASGQALTFNGTNVVWGTPNANLLLPYSGTANVANGALLTLQNTSNNFSSAIRANAALGDAFITDSANMGLRVRRARTTGIMIDSSGGDGLAITRARVSAITIDSAGFFGLSIRRAARTAITVDSVGTALFLRYGTDAIAMDNVSYGMTIRTARNGGISIDSATIGMQMRVASNFFNFGVATNTGIYIDSTASDGINIRATAREGLRIDRASIDGVHVTTIGATTAGVHGAHNNTGGLGRGVFGETNSTAPGANVLSGATGVWGEVTSSSPGGFSAAVRGINNGSGALGIGVAGYQAGSGWGVYGETPNGWALHGRATGTGNALVAQASAGTSSTLANNCALFKSSIGVNVARIDNTGKGFFNGGTQTGGADVAEAFAVEGERAAYEPGDVLVISRASDRTVEKSGEAYSSLVVGVYATKPGVLLTERNVEESQDDLVPMGVVGVIPTKVCTENGAIRRGDLLVTSSISGCAMRATPEEARNHPGAVIGKALQDYDADGIGRIQVLVNVK